MNRSPSNFDLQKYVGEKLSQICIDQYQVQLKFETLSICGDGRMELESENSKTVLLDGKWISTNGLEHLIGQKITEWGVLGGEFGFYLLIGKSKLLFYTKESPYEDFVVSLGEADWIVL